MLSRAACAVASVFSCATVRSQVVSLSEEGIKNADASRQAAKNILGAWKLNSGFIRESIGAQLPQSAIESMNKLDAISLKEKPDDFDLGTTLAAYAKVWIEVAKTTVTEILKFIPKF